MKSLQRWLGAMAFIGIFATACADMDESYDGSYWRGEYDEMAETAVIDLFFEQGGTECTVAFGYKGYCVKSAEKYEARWSRKNKFSLYRSSGTQFQLCYTGIISGDKMKLQAHNCDGVAATYELSFYMNYLQPSPTVCI